MRLSRVLKLAHYIHIGEESVKQAINALPKGEEEEKKKMRLNSDAKTEIINLLDKAAPKQLEKILSYSRKLFKQ